DAGDGASLAGGVEAGIVAEALGGSAADVAFAGPLLARDLARRAGGREREAVAVGFTAGLDRAAVVAEAATSAPVYVIDADDALEAAYVLVPEGSGYRLAQVPVHGARTGSDLTRRVRVIPAGAAVGAIESSRRLLSRADLVQWSALGLALTSAHLVGVMRGVRAVRVAYAADRRRSGAP